MSYVVSAVGPWSVHAGTRISDDGATQVTVINDGEHEYVTAADPAQLMVALAQHLGVRSISHDD